MNYRLGLLGVLVVLPSVGCGEEPQPDEVEINLETVERAFEPLEYDSGWVEVATGISVQLVASLETEVEQTATVLARGAELEPQPDSGTFLIRGTLDIELFADVDSNGQVFQGSLGTSSVSVESELATYDPFLIMESIVPLLNTQQPGDATFKEGLLSYRVQNGFRILPTLEGVCVAVDEDREVMQYVNELAWEVEYGPSIWVGLDTPLGAPSRLGEAGITFSAELTPPRQFDLGTHALDNGAAVDGVGPCGAVVDGELVE
ncbi:MAG: hypothetical protein ACRBN8_00720 [Nannocystales bacterium]